jgi:hypothetical protein
MMDGDSASPAGAAIRSGGESSSDERCEVGDSPGTCGHQRRFSQTIGLAPRHGDRHVIVECLGVRSIQRVVLEPCDDQLALSVWPGELKPQALWLYDAGRAERLLAVAREDGWQIRATPHLAFRTSSWSERNYLHPALDPDTYVRRWSGEDRPSIGGYRVAAVPELWEWLHRRGYASAADTAVDRDAFMAGVRLQPVHLRPGLHLTKLWESADAERLDASDDLAPALRGSLNPLLDALDEPSIAAPIGDGSHATRWAPVPLERTKHSSFAIRGTPEERLARRAEALLVGRYAASLAPDHLCRARVVTETGVLYSDLYNETRRQLVEAKATATRPSVRMAIGQLADYARFIVPPAALAVLVPVRPSRDLLALLATVRVAVVWEEGETFADSTGGDVT